MEIVNIKPYILNNLMNYKQTITLKWDILKVGLYFLSENSLNEIKSAYKLIDRENKGFIVEEDLI